MIIYTACNSPYFDLYFTYWATAINRHYPDTLKYIAIENPTDKQLIQCRQQGVIPLPFELRKQREDESFEDYKGIFYLLRWMQLPWQLNEPILETQVNCIAVQKQIFEINIDHLRICRMKRGNLGGLSCALFSPDAAKRIAQKAFALSYVPPQYDNVIDAWQLENIPHQKVLAEQQFGGLGGKLESWCCWITSRTANVLTHGQKLEIIRHYSGIV